MSATRQPEKTPEVNSGTTTSWLALTTAFPYKDPCSSAFYGDIRPPSYIDIGAFDPWVGFLVPSLTCLPPEATRWWRQDMQAPVGGLTSVSLGPFVCPEAYTTASTSAKDKSSTLVACCPSDYDFKAIKRQGQVGQCVSTLSADNTYTAYGSANGKIFTNSTSGVVRTIFGIQVNGWVFAEATSTSTLSSTGAPATVPATPTLSSALADSGLSNGAKAGIGVGVSLGVIVLVGAIAGFIMLHRRRKAAKFPPISNPYMGQPPKDMYAAPYVAPQYMQQPQPRPLHMAPVELDNSHVMRQDKPLPIPREQPVELAAGK